MARILAIVLLAGSVVAQTPGPVEPEAAVAPGDIVLSLRGSCSASPSPSAASAEDCTVVVRRQQFDNLLKIVAPGGQVTPTVKQSLARSYADLYAFQLAARKSGIDISPQFQDTMEWLRLRTLADLYRRDLEKQSVASEQEIDNYYRQHVAEFEEVKLRRMLLPKNNFAVADQQQAEKKALEIANDFRERAAKGEDLDQLQREAYTAAGFNVLPPTTEVGYRRRSALASEVSEDVFALQPGEVSKVEKETYSFVIYKVDAKRTLPMERVRDEISRGIAKTKLEAALQSVTGTVQADLNESYFGPAAKP
jgi:parvulin-like peptidyl-prolyl isomerase